MSSSRRRTYNDSSEGSFSSDMVLFPDSEFTNLYIYDKKSNSIKYIDRDKNLILYESLKIIKSDLGSSALSYESVWNVGNLLMITVELPYQSSSEDVYTTYIFDGIDKGPAKIIKGRLRVPSSNVYNINIVLCALAKKLRNEEDTTYVNSILIH